MNRSLPDDDAAAIHVITRLYANDLNKFCGIPARQELIVPIARGCPVGCSFCDVPRMYARRPVRRLKDFPSTRRRWRPMRRTNVGAISINGAAASTIKAPKHVAWKTHFPVSSCRPEARPYLFDGASAAPAGGEYCGAVFLLRTARGGLFGLLWTREEGKWKLVLTGRMIRE